LDHTPPELLQKLLEAVQQLPLAPLKAAQLVMAGGRKIAWDLHAYIYV
jgi:hypothetical protein